MAEDILEAEVADEVVPDEVVQDEVVQDEVVDTPVEPETTADDIRMLRDVGNELGYDLSKFDDDESALKHLIGQAKIAGESVQQSDIYRQQLQAQQQPAQQAPPVEDKPLWDPPPFNPMWVTQVQRDDAGNLLPTNGGTAETVANLQKWAGWRQEKQDQFWNNPYEFLRPYIEQVADERAGAGIRSDRNYTHAEQLVEKNADWLYTDSSRQQYSPDGDVYAKAIQSFGQENPAATARQQDTFAMSQVQGARGERAITELAELKSQNAASNGHEAKKKAAIATKTNSSGTLQQDVQNPDLSLHDQLTAALKSAGVEDADLEDSR